jgi:pyruvate dehydrogenase E1 component
MIFDGHVHQLPDIDPVETEEWLDSLDALVDTHGKSRARFIVTKLLERATQLQVGFPATVSTPYVNRSPGSRGTRRSSAGSAGSSGGTPP